MDKQLLEQLTLGIKPVKQSNTENIDIKINTTSKDLYSGLTNYIYY